MHFVVNEWILPIYLLFSQQKFDDEVEFIKPLLRGRLRRSLKLSPLNIFPEQRFVR